MPSNAFTIAKLATAASVGVETVRYYQRRGLLDEPSSRGTFREYSSAEVQRLQFIKRAQDLGFTLDDIAELVSLSAERDKERVREVAQRRLAEIRQRTVQLNAMAIALQGLVGCCERTAAGECPIISALTSDSCPAAAAEQTRKTPVRTRSRSGDAAVAHARRRVAA